jgi:hypothetical protein
LAQLSPTESYNTALGRGFQLPIHRRILGLLPLQIPGDEIEEGELRFEDPPPRYPKHLPASAVLHLVLGRVRVTLQVVLRALLL